MYAPRNSVAQEQGPLHQYESESPTTTNQENWWKNLLKKEHKWCCSYAEFLSTAFKNIYTGSASTSGARWNGVQHVHCKKCQQFLKQCKSCTHWGTHIGDLIALIAYHVQGSPLSALTWSTRLVLCTTRGTGNTRSQFQCTTYAWRAELAPPASCCLLHVRYRKPAKAFTRMPLHWLALL